MDGLRYLSGSSCLKGKAMSTIRAKVVGYDEATQSLLVSFASDKTKFQDPEKYPAYAIQAVSLGSSTDAEKLKLEIAKIGVSIVQAQEAKEEVEASPAKSAAVRSLIGKQFSCSLQDVYAGNSYPNEVVL